MTGVLSPNFRSSPQIRRIRTDWGVSTDDDGVSIFAKIRDQFFKRYRRMPNDRGCRDYLSLGDCLLFSGRPAPHLWLIFFHGTYGMSLASWGPYGNSTNPVGKKYAKRQGEWLISLPYKASSCLEPMDYPD